MSSNRPTSLSLAAIGRLLPILAVCLADLLAPERRAFADGIVTQPSVSDPSISTLELEAELYGLDPADFYSLSDGSQLWTNQANAALYGNLMELILTLGGDNAMIDQLFAPGAVFSGSGSTPAANVNANVLSGSSSQSATPEPGTMGLLGGTLLLLTCYAIYCARARNHAAPE
jgi:hypothetical protein